VWGHVEQRFLTFRGEGKTPVKANVGVGTPPRKHNAQCNLAQAVGGMDLRLRTALQRKKHLGIFNRGKNQIFWVDKPALPTVGQRLEKNRTEERNSMEI
jgi:hypothetical protein